MTIPNKLGVYLQKSKLYPFIRTCYRRTLRRFIPTQQMVIDKRYFEQNRWKFQKTHSLLDDELSKRTYKTILGNRIQGRGERELREIAQKEQEQYFSPDLIRLKEEYFVDCGAYNGDTIRNFLACPHDGVGAIYAFEPNQENFEALKRFLETKCGDIPYQVYNLGTWNEKDTLRFSGTGTGGAITEEGNIEIEVDSLDYVLAGKKVTFIKMDVEGSETKSLIGAKKLILEQRPILAICIYHSMEDMACIPVMLSEWLHDYRFYIRHYTLTSAETVFYAIPKEREGR